MSNGIGPTGASGGAANLFQQIQNTQPRGGAASAGGGTSTGGVSTGGTLAGTAGSQSADSTTSGVSGLAGTDTFLKLLVAQLRNQDPTSPMDNQAFVTELAQFNTVEQMINLKQEITTQVSAQQAAEGVALLGKSITYNVQGLGNAKSTSAQGQVSGVELAGGGVALQVGNAQVQLSEVTAVNG